MIKEKQGGYKWVILALMCLGTCVAQYAQFMMSQWGTPWLNAHGIVGDVALVQAKFVELNTAPLIPGVFFSLISGVLVDRFGLKRVLMVFLSVTVAAVILRIWASTYAVMFACMVGIGFVTTFFNTNQMKLAGRWFPPETVGVAVGIFAAINNGSMALGTQIATLFPSYGPTFVSAAIACAVIWIAWLTLGRERPAVPVGGGEEKTPPVSDCLKVVVRSRKLWITAIAIMMFQSAALTISQFLPEALRQAGYDDTLSATVTSVFTLSALVGCLINPKLFSKLPRPKLAFAVIGTVAGLGIMFAWRIPFLPVKLVCLAILGLITLGMMPLLIALPLSFPEIGKTYAGTAGGFIATLMLAANVLIPSFVTMPLAGGDYELFYFFEGVIMLLFVCLTPFLPIYRKETNA